MYTQRIIVTKIKYNLETINKICSRAHYLATQMIHLANTRKNKEKGDPKVGGHASASASCLHVLGALHLVVKSGYDFFANKPHASPSDHSYNYLLDLFLNEDKSKLNLSEKNQAMTNLRAFPTEESPRVFQSYHSAYDSDHHGFLPTGTVGIPPVNVGYLGHAYRFGKKQGYKVPKAHFWALIGDSEFREGSLAEAIPEFAERQLGNLTWILDYNRQSLDGHRMTNTEIMNGTDDTRVERYLIANGWDVIQIRHGSLRKKLFKTKGGTNFKTWLEETLSDYELQVLLLLDTETKLISHLKKTYPELKDFLKANKASEIFYGLRDLGGHDLTEVIKAMEDSKKNPNKPCFIIAHTIKGWGLKMAASQGNHSALPPQTEIDTLKNTQKITTENLFEGFKSTSKEGSFLKSRGNELYKEILELDKIKKSNTDQYMKAYKGLPSSLDINFKMTSYPHTQWMLGQLTAKLTRIANTPEKLSSKDAKTKKALTESELLWKNPADLLVTMAPDVGTSTNLNPAMDGKIFGANIVDDMETKLDVKDTKLPDLIPGEDNSDRFIRFEIAEANTMSCMGSYGKLYEFLGIPVLPLMTVYDFFVKRAHDQFFYNLYWNASFICVGTPSGVTLSPEGAQHGWKSDFQIPNQITWEPFFCAELDWIICDAMRRHVEQDNVGRTGVYIRGVTRGANQKDLPFYLKRQKRFKQNISHQESLHLKEFPLSGSTEESGLATHSEAEIYETLRKDVLNGAYYLIDFRGYAGYIPGDNVVNIFSLGSLGTEAIKASNELLKKGIYANVIVVTCTDLLIGNQAHANNYTHLKNTLNVSGDLYFNNGGPKISRELSTYSGRRIPIVSVHDGEPGLLDNIGSIVGVKQECLAVRKHSKCGRPSEIYKFHGIDADSIIDAAGKVLSETALENVQINPKEAPKLAHVFKAKTWKELW